ncbi:MAG: Sapep family Mn(2+)-dependent dipeptidase [Clostridia bacterium]|nr:Sapep family Mn(2+)-dependent dipeptidase [Clostridia bacterium]
MLEKWIDAHLGEEMEDLKTLLRIPSVSRGTPEPGMPLGREVSRALDCAVDLGKKFGFEGRNIDGYCAVIDFGEGDELLMIADHLDVVPAGKGWDTDPFEPAEVDGRLVARGVLDNKGPAVCALYGMAAVKAAGLKMKRRVRLFLGGDEEVGWKCVDRYRETEELPALGFTPDACYPVVNSEMGIYQVQYKRTMENSGVRIHCGIAANVVPGEAEAVLPCEAVPCEVPEGFTAEFDGNVIRVKGRGGHAAMNDLAKNALCCLLDLLAQQPLAPEDSAVAQSLHAFFDYDLHGEGFDVDVKDESGYCTLSLDMLEWDENGVLLTIDSRHPFSLAKETLEEKLDAAFGCILFERIPLKHQPGHFIPADSELVSTLMDVYTQVTGKVSAPQTMGGGTYARAFPNSVAFGMSPENEPDECHMPNEGMTLASFRENTLIMAEAIRRLATEG